MKKKQVRLCAFRFHPHINDPLCPQKDRLENRTFHGRSYLEDDAYFKNRMNDLVQKEDSIKGYVIEHECIFNRFLSSPQAEPFKNSSYGKLIYASRLVPREAMTSGRRDLLRLQWSKDSHPDEIFFMIDANMCYSYVVRNYP